MQKWVFCTCTYSHQFGHVGINVLQTYPGKFEFCICVQVWGDYPCPMQKIIKYNIKMLHFVLFHRVTSYNKFIVSCIHVDTTKLPNVTCTLVVMSAIIQSLECSLDLKPSVNSLGPIFLLLTNRIGRSSLVLDPSVNTQS